MRKLFYFQYVAKFIIHRVFKDTTIYLSYVLLDISRDTLMCLWNSSLKFSSWSAFLAG